MRESIGGTWILGFVVLFVVLFSGYLAVSVNYTKAFKAKNKIINVIEENEGFTTTNFVGQIESQTLDSLKNSNSTEDKIYAYLKEIGYATTKLDSNKCESGNMYSGGYCIKKVCSSNGAYYKVTSFVKIELPIVWSTFTVPIKGETKVIYFTEDNLSC